MKEEEEKVTVQELYDFITSQISPEKALMRLLESSVINYEKLKFNEGEEIHPIILISLAAMDMGWQISVEKEEISENIRGLSVGTEEYMKELFKDEDREN